MRKYWLYTYVLQAAAVLMMLSVLPLQWHTVHGSGFDLLKLALETKIPFGLGDPFDPDYIAISQWWIIWNILFAGIVLGLRATTGYIFERLHGQRKAVAATVVLLAVSFGWYSAAYYDGILLGFWLEVIAAGVLVGSVGVEMMLPEKRREEIRLERLPPDHPDRLMQGDYRICPACGEFNNIHVKNCRECNHVLYPNRF